MIFRQEADFGVLQKYASYSVYNSFEKLRKVVKFVLSFGQILPRFLNHYMQFKCTPWRPVQHHIWSECEIVYWTFHCACSAYTLKYQNIQFDTPVYNFLLYTFAVKGICGSDIRIDKSIEKPCVVFSEYILVVFEA